MNHSPFVIAHQLQLRPLAELRHGKSGFVNGADEAARVVGNHFADAEVVLTSVDDLPYVLGLIRQAFEKQMGNGGEA